MPPDDPDLFEELDPLTLDVPDLEHADADDPLTAALAELHDVPELARVVLWAIAEGQGHDPAMLCPDAAGYDVSDIAAAADVDAVITAAREVVAWPG